ncbi:TPA: dTDP-4-dehydrorhamnose 3,5-epimerase family protein, partial [Klebsiella pneumoniae]|nr:dTDP-4-dehydrorhamnose 3,5-epimerase family protein [Klebsiella pneumoniae]
GCLAWDDSDVNIKWPIDFTPILSDKDKKGLNLKDLSKVLGELK